MTRRALLPLAFVCLLAQPSSAQERTVLIRNGRVLDGAGNPWIVADVLLRGDRIAAVGRLGPVPADEVVDATGLYVAPGFIDTHSHAGAALAGAALSHGRPLLAQGLTTVFANPDGGGPVDLAAQRADFERNRLGPNVGDPHGPGR